MDVGIVERIVLFWNFVGWMFGRGRFVMEKVRRQSLGVFRGRCEVREPFIQDKDPLVVHLDPGARKNLATIGIYQKQGP